MRTRESLDLLIQCDFRSSSVRIASRKPELDPLSRYPISTATAELVRLEKKERGCISLCCLVNVECSCLVLCAFMFFVATVLSCDCGMQLSCHVHGRAYFVGLNFIGTRESEPTCLQRQQRIAGSKNVAHAIQPHPRPAPQRHGPQNSRASEISTQISARQKL